MLAHSSVIMQCYLLGPSRVLRTNKHKFLALYSPSSALMTWLNRAVRGNPSIKRSMLPIHFHYCILLFPPLPNPSHPIPSHPIPSHPIPFLLTRPPTYVNAHQSHASSSSPSSSTPWLPGYEGRHIAVHRTKIADTVTATFVGSLSNGFAMAR